MKKARPKSKKVTSTKKSALHQAYLAKEQEDFHKAHPNAEKLIMIFIVLTILLGGLYYARYGFALMP